MPIESVELDVLVELAEDVELALSEPLVEAGADHESGGGACDTLEVEEDDSAFDELPIAELAEFRSVAVGLASLAVEL